MSSLDVPPSSKAGHVRFRDPTNHLHSLKDSGISSLIHISKLSPFNTVVIQLLPLYATLRHIEAAIKNEG